MASLVENGGSREKVVNVLSLCSYYLLLTKCMVLHWNKLELYSPRNAVCQVLWDMT